MDGFLNRNPLANSAAEAIFRLCLTRSSYRLAQDEFSRDANLDSRTALLNHRSESFDCALADFSSGNIYARQRWVGVLAKWAVIETDDGDVIRYFFPCFLKAAQESDRVRIGVGDDAREFELVQRFLSAFNTGLKSCSAGAGHFMRCQTWEAVYRRLESGQSHEGAPQVRPKSSAR